MFKKGQSPWNKGKNAIKMGDRFNHLIAIKFNYRNKTKNQYWLFKCDCGKEKVIRVNDVKNGNTKSCGCLNTNLIHGMYKTKIYRIYASMKQRCLNKNDKGYKNYGGRGIKVCDEWLGENGFENFFRDMGDRPEDKSLDRIKNSLGYCKSNCRWATRIEQNNNTRFNHLITYRNKTQTIAQWARDLGISQITIHSRLRYGWSIERTLTFNL